MDHIIHDIGSRISAWLWFARSTSLGSGEFVTDLLDEVGAPARRAHEADEPR